MKTMPVDALGVLGGEQQAALRAGRERDAHRAVDPAGVHARRSRPARTRSRRTPRRPGAVRAAVAARVEADDAEVTREVRDLRLPDARVDERPGRQEEQGLLALAVGLPEHAHAVALDEALLVRVAGAGLLSSLRALLGTAVVTSCGPSSPRATLASARSSRAARRGPRRSPPGARARSPGRRSSSSRRAPRPGTRPRRGRTPRAARSNASRSTPRHSALTRAIRGRSSGRFHDSACSSIQIFE